MARDCDVGTWHSIFISSHAGLQHGGIFCRDQASHAGGARGAEQDRAVAYRCVSDRCCQRRPGTATRTNQVQMMTEALGAAGRLAGEPATTTAFPPRKRQVRTKTLRSRMARGGGRPCTSALATRGAVHTAGRRRGSYSSRSKTSITKKKSSWQPRVLEIRSYIFRCLVLLRTGITEEVDR